MRSHSIHIPFPQKCIDQFHVSKTDQIAKFGNSLIRPLQKDTFWFACRLDCKVLSFQITQFMNVTVLIYSNHLAACYVWSGPTIIVKSSFHGKTSHDTINFSTFYQLFFLFPIDLNDLRPIPHSSKCFRRQFNIYTCRDTILIQEIIRRIIVTSNFYNRFFCCVRHFICLITSCQSCH